MRICHESPGVKRSPASYVSFFPNPCAFREINHQKPGFSGSLPAADFRMRQTIVLQRLPTSLHLISSYPINPCRQEITLQKRYKPSLNSLPARAVGLSLQTFAHGLSLNAINQNCAVASATIAADSRSFSAKRQPAANLLGIVERQAAKLTIACRRPTGETKRLLRRIAGRKTRR